MPSADFCNEVRLPHDCLNPLWNTLQTSRGKLDRLRHNLSDLQQRSLVDMNLIGYGLWRAGNYSVLKLSSRAES